MLTRHDPRYERAFEEQLRALPQVVWADSIAGETDYLLSIVARDVSELQQVLSRLTARGARIVTYLRLREVKPMSPLPLDQRPTPATPRSPRGRKADPRGREAEQ